MKRNVLFVVIIIGILNYMYGQPSDFPSEDYIYNENASIDYRLVKAMRQNGEIISIGDRVSNEVKEKANCIIETRMFNVHFGPINAYDDGDLIVAWNKQGAIMYIEILSDSLSIVDGIKIGFPREKVLNTLGVPSIEYSDGMLRYQNTEYEMIGIQFEFNNEKVSRIVLFGYV